MVGGYRDSLVGTYTGAYVITLHKESCESLNMTDCSCYYFLNNKTHR